MMNKEMVFIELKKYDEMVNDLRLYKEMFRKIYEMTNDTKIKDYIDGIDICLKGWV